MLTVEFTFVFVSTFCTLRSICLPIYIVRLKINTTMPMQQLTFVPAAGKSIMCKGDSVDMTQQEANEDHNHILDTLNHPWSVVPPEIRSL